MKLIDILLDIAYSPISNRDFVRVIDDEDIKTELDNAHMYIITKKARHHQYVW